MSPPAPRLSIVAVVDGRWAETHPWLAALPAQAAGIPHEIIAVDDGTQDETVEALPRLGCVTTSLRSDARVGFAAAANAGASAARGEWLVLVRCGARLGSGWLQALARAAADGAPGLPAPGGAPDALAIPRAPFAAAGGYDERLGRPAADQDLVRRLGARGVPVHAAEAPRRERPSAARRLAGQADAGLIMDFGMHHAQDTAFYLAKGFRVVAVEANPALAEAARRRFAGEIAAGRLVVEAVGVGAAEGVLPFYRNLEKDEWSSFDPAWGTRNGTRYDVVEVPCVQPEVLFQRHGVPHYVKIDIEGADMYVVRALQGLAARPRYVSVEENQAWYFAELWAAGYRRFKLVNQRQVPLLRCPVPAREGREVDARFEGGSTGPFGEETPGEWKGFDEIVHEYQARVRSPGAYHAGDDWFDIHAAADE